MEAEAINTGRRPIILTTMCFDGENGEGWRIALGEDSKGVRLNENEKFTKTIEHSRQSSMLWGGPDENEKAVDLWFEDTVGKRYHVKGAKKHLVRLLNERHQLKAGEN